MKAIILDGSLKSALATVRSLGEHGVSFRVGAERSTAMALHSRYTGETFLYPSPHYNKEKFIDKLIEIAEDMGDKPLIYAFSDATHLSLVRHRIRLEKVARLVLPESQHAEVAANKRKTLELARELDIRIPVTNALDDLDDIAALSKKLSYPAVVKPQHSFEWKDGVGVRGEVKVVHSPGDLMAYTARVFTETNEMPLVQGYIRGAEFGVELLCDKGEVIAYTIHKRIRSLKPSGGASVVKKSAKLDGYTREMLSSSKKLAKALKWRGVMMVEFKVNKRSEKVSLIEINGRFWGSLPLSIFSGIDYPTLMYELALGKEVKGEKQKDDVASRHLLGDIKHLLHVLIDRNPLRDEVYPSRGRAIKNFFKEGNYRYDVLQRNDLTPFFWEMIDVIAKALKPL